MQLGLHLAWSLFLSQLVLLADIDSCTDNFSHLYFESSAEKAADKMPWLQQPDSGSLPAVPGLWPWFEKPLSGLLQDRGT